MTRSGFASMPYMSSPTSLSPKNAFKGNYSIQRQGLPEYFSLSLGNENAIRKLYPLKYPG